MSDKECTTDALPTPPRDRKRYPPKDNKKKPKVSESESEEENEKVFQNGRSPINQASMFVQISNSTGIHVGTNLYLGNGQKTAKKPIIKETEKIKSLKNSNEPVTRRDIGILSEHMCSGWEDAARTLGFSDGQIEAFEYSHPKNIKQTKYDLLKDWIEYKGKDKATVGILAQVLWEKDQREALKRWSEEYDKIHSDNTYF